MIFPSLKDKMKIFQDESSKRESANKEPGAGQGTFVKRAELEKIVEIETKRKL